MENIIKIDYMSDIDTYVSNLNPQKTILFFDIDNTLLRTVSDIGSAEWIRWQEKLLYDHKGNHKHSVATTFEQLYILYRHWLTTSACITELVEEYVADLINKYINNGFKVILVTARDETTANTTMQQLEQHYDTKKFYTPDLYFRNHKVLFNNGVLFGAGGRKGETITNLLSIIKTVFNYEPENIVFVDDSVAECISVANKFSCNKIKSFVFNYLNATKYREIFDNLNTQELHEKWQEFIMSTINILSE